VGDARPLLFTSLAAADDDDDGDGDDDDDEETGGRCLEDEELKGDVDIPRLAADTTQH